MAERPRTLASRRHWFLQVVMATSGSRQTMAAISYRFPSSSLLGSVRMVDSSAVMGGGERGVPLFLVYKMLFLGYNVPRRWCLFWDSKNLFWDTKTFLGNTKKKFGDTETFFWTKFLVDQNPRTSHKLQQIKKITKIKKIRKKQKIFLIFFDFFLV